MCNSNVDELLNLGLYIVFERDHCYPRYLIEYKVGRSTMNSPNANAISSRSTATFLSNLFTTTTISTRTSASALRGKQSYCDIYSPSQHTNYSNQLRHILSQSSNTTVSLPTTKIAQSASFRTTHPSSSNLLPSLIQHHHVIQAPQKTGFQCQYFSTKVPHPPEPRQQQHFMQAPQVADLRDHYVPIQVRQTAELQHQHHQAQVSQISGFQHQYCSIEGCQIAGIQHQNHGMQAPQLSNLQLQHQGMPAPQIVNPQHRHFSLQVPQIADTQHQHLHAQDPQIVIPQQFKKI